MTDRPADAQRFPVESFAWPAGRRAAVSLTFDDARQSQVATGIPILGRHGLRGTFFVSIGSLEQRPDDWKRAAETGHEIANHTLTHPCSGNFGFAHGNALELYTLDRMEDELTEASETIEQLVGVRPRTFAYPCGQTYVGRGENARSYVPLVARHFLAGRNAFDEIHNDPTFCDLAQLFSLDADQKGLDTLLGWVGAARAAGGWLILMVHDIGGDGRQTINAQVLDSLCRELTATPDVWVDTMAAVAEHIAATRR